MTPVWSDLSVRSCGLGSRLLNRAALQQLGNAPDLHTLTEHLRLAGVVSQSTTLRSSGLERELRRRSTSMLRTLMRWAGPSRVKHLVIFLEDEDRRSVRALVRGVLQGASASQKLAGLIPTPLLPERALETLAQFNTTTEIGGALSAWNHPLGPALDVLAGQVLPDLFAFERDLDRIFLRRSLRSTNRAGTVLRQFVAQTIDLHNACAGLVLSTRGGDIDPATCFIEGGITIRLDDFVRIAEATTTSALAQLRRIFAGTLFKNAFLDSSRVVETSALRESLRCYGALARTDPIGAAPIIKFLLALRAESVDLRRVIATILTGAPRQDLSARLVTLT